MIAMMVFFAVTGTVNDDLGDFSVLNIVGTAIIVIGMIALAVVENKLARKEANELAVTNEEKKKNRK